VKVFSHNVTGGFFPTVEDAKSYNADDPDADLYSRLDHIEKYRKEGVFHIRICYKELDEFDFPCNEWTQSSNFVKEVNITDYEEIDITFDESGNGGNFVGLGLSPSSHSNTLVDADPHGGTWSFCIGCIKGYPNPSGASMPGPFDRVIQKVELYLAQSINS
jgi:hypothetical protein